MKITSSSNPRIKETLRLQERRERDNRALFLIEGFREIRRAILAKYPLHTLFFCPELFLGSQEEEWIAKGPWERIECTKQVFHKLSYRDRPDGLLAIAPQIHRDLTHLPHLLEEKTTPLLLVAERIEKPGNLGSILRSSDAAGVDALLLCDPTTDLFNPNVVRASVGTLFTLPVVQGSSKEALSFLRARGIRTVAATPHATQEFTEANLTVPLAILVGTEQYGLSPLWMNEATEQIKIPMFGEADSLNVAAATTLLLYEAVRQRRSALRGQPPPRR